MADDWKPGDLALCVRGGAVHPGTRAPELPRIGAVYTVDAFGTSGFRGGPAPAFWLVDGPKNNDGQRVWGASRFRKIEDHVPDAEDEETIRLLNGAPCNPPSHVVTREVEKTHDR